MSVTDSLEKLSEYYLSNSNLYCE